MFNFWNEGGPGHFVAVSFFGFFPTTKIGSASARASYPQHMYFWSAEGLIIWILNFRIETSFFRETIG